MADTAKLLDSTARPPSISIADDEQSTTEVIEEKPSSKGRGAAETNGLAEAEVEVVEPRREATTDRRSSTASTLSKEYNEKRWSRGSRLSGIGSTPWRRRTYNGSTTSLTAQSTSRFSTASLDTYCTATSYLGSWRTAPSEFGDDGNHKQRSAVSRTFRKLLERGGLASLVEEEDDDEEFDWCGRGMHVEFKSGEAVPLEICDSAGHGSTATVDIVRCRRIRLARKLTHLRWGISQRDLLREAQALRKLKHAHVVQLVGTYTKGRMFAALIYPVADMDLAHYLEEGRSMSAETDISWAATPIKERAYEYKDVLSKGSLCLISALRYVHQCGVKHMDIKPANILLKKCSSAEAYNFKMVYKMYLCDFGISQVFNPEEQSQTETYPGKTPIYASPEVASDERHGRASDIFSLGCVLTEMATVYSE